MMRAPVAIRIGGVWLDQITRSYSDIKVGWRRDGGCWSLTATINVADGDLPPAFVEARPFVEVLLGSARIWQGTLDATEGWASGEISASGVARQAETAVATDFTGHTLNVADAVYFGAARGAFQVGTLDALGTISPDTPTDSNYIGALLDTWSLSQGRRWVVDENRLLYTATDPTVPSLFVAPGNGELPVTTQVQCTALWLQYTERTTLATRSVNVSATNAGARIERIVDFTSQPSMTTAEATALAGKIIAQVGAQKQFSGSITVPVSAVTNAHAVPVDGALIRAGAMVRLNGARDGRNGRPYTDFVAGETTWDVTPSEITFTPLDAVETSLEGVVEALGGETR